MKNWILLAALAGGTADAGAGDRTEALKPPMAKKVAKVDTLHGEKLVDDYFWLRDRKNPEVRAYLETENAYADAFMKPTETLQTKLYDEMLGRIKETDLSVPFRQGEYLYYSRTEKGKQYPIYCRKKGSIEAPEQVMLDLNELARGERFMAVAELEVSDDGNLLAYTTDNVGFREYRLHVKDLSKGKDFPEIVEKVSSAAWAADNKTLFYTVDDHAKRPYRLYRHTLGADPRTDVLVFEEKDEMYRANVHRSRSRKVLFLVSGSHTADEWRFLDSDKPAGLFTMISPREKEHEYAVDHRGDVFYIRTNKGCRNFRVVT
ncbi:MAG TPA: oligopeptidase B, partial [Thermoanaerobaculia bacterium]|nr:oligopeptidase B [Thermoanaerobaculia bacterium]